MQHNFLSIFNIGQSLYTEVLDDLWQMIGNFRYSDHFALLKVEFLAYFLYTHIKSIQNSTYTKPINSILAWRLVKKVS